MQQNIVHRLSQKTNINNIDVKLSILFSFFFFRIFPRDRQKQSRNTKIQGKLLFNLVTISDFNLETERKAK